MVGELAVVGGVGGLECWGLGWAGIDRDCAIWLGL